MKNLNRQMLAAIAPMTSIGTAMAQEAIIPELCIRAETDFSLGDFQNNAGGRINQFFYISTPPAQ